jgi:hypothetical protein
MDERARKVGRNEALFRQVNEELEALERRTASALRGTLEIVCECGDLRCDQRIPIAVGLYEAVRADPARFVVLPGHEIPSVEEVVETAGGYVVVQKRAGDPEELAKQTNPRS